MILLFPTLVLTGCGPTPEVEAPPLPKLPTAQTRSAAPPSGPSLAPLATRQQVVRAVDVGRPDPFAAVLTPRLTSPPTPPASQKRAAATPLEPPKGLVFQGVLQGPMGSEALVQYVPATSKGDTIRSGSLRVGDMGSDQGDSLLPPGWHVRDIDAAQGLLVLQRGNQSIKLQL